MASNIPIKQKKSRAARRKQTAEAGRAAKENFLKVKAEVIKQERENLQSLYVIKMPDGWYEMLGNSAVIYVYSLAKRLKIHPKIIPDTDYNHVAEDGIVTFQNLDAFEERMRKLKIYRRYSSEWLIIFDLGMKYTQQDINDLKRIDEVKLAQANKLIVPELVFPELKVSIQELLKAIHPNVRKMDPMGRQLVGDSLDSAAGDMLEEFALTMNGWEDARLFLDRSLKRIAKIEAKMLIIITLQMFSVSQIDKILEETGKTKKRIMDAHKKLDKKQQKEKNIGEQIYKRKVKQEENKKV